MKGNVYQFTPAGAAPAHQAEPLDAAVLEVSARIATNSDERRRLFTRLDDLRGLSPELRRRRPRAEAPSLSRPVTFFSIEEAAGDDTPALAAGGLR
jgi:hypothetical protein